MLASPADVRDDADVAEGESDNMPPLMRETAFEAALSTGVAADASTAQLQAAGDAVVRRMRVRFGGDWFCIVGKQTSPTSTNFSYCVPSVRCIVFLLRRAAHVFFVAQIFAPYVPSGGAGPAAAPP